MEMEQANKTAAAVTVTDDYAVIVSDKEGLLEFFKNGNNLENLYTVIEKKAKGLVADVTTKEGRSQIKSAARQIASVKTKIEDLGKNVVAELKALPKFIDANRKNLREKLEAEARAAAEKARLEREKAEAERKATEAEKARKEAQERAERAEMERKAVESKNGNALDDCKAPHSTVSSPAPAPSKWTPEMKAVNKAVYEQIAAYVLPEIKKTIVGFTENGYRVAAEEAAKAVLQKENDGMKKTANELRFYARMLVCGC